MKISDIDAMINLTLEIEGLLILARERGESTPDEVFAMLEAKIARLAGNSCEASPGADDVAVARSAVFEEEADAGSDAGQSEAPDNDPDTDRPEPAGMAVAMDKPTEAAGVAAMRLDEKLARDGARDIRKAFTINDRFRFRRELFSNSESRLNDSLDIIAAMTSFDEAEDYFYNDLCWDRDSADVKDFMAIVANHFGADVR